MNVGMGADNGIYIGHFDDGFRVIEAPAIWLIHESDSELLAYFAGAMVWETLDEAYEFAKHLQTCIEKEADEGGYPFISYGIQILELGDWPKK